jgi:hypothetical protein
MLRRFERLRIVVYRIIARCNADSQDALSRRKAGRSGRDRSSLRAAKRLRNTRSDSVAFFKAPGITGESENHHQCASSSRTAARRTPAGLCASSRPMRAIDDAFQFDAALLRIAIEFFLATDSTFLSLAPHVRLHALCDSIRFV